MCDADDADAERQSLPSKSRINGQRRGVSNRNHSHRPYKKRHAFSCIFMRDVHWEYFSMIEIYTVMWQIYNMFYISRICISIHKKKTLTYVHTLITYVYDRVPTYIRLRNCKPCLRFDNKVFKNIYVTINKTLIRKVLLHWRQDRDDLPTTCCHIYTVCF